MTNRFPIQVKQLFDPLRHNFSLSPVPPSISLMVPLPIIPMTESAVFMMTVILIKAIMRTNCTPSVMNWRRREEDRRRRMMYAWCIKCDHRDRQTHKEPDRYVPRPGCLRKHDHRPQHSRHKHCLVSFHDLCSSFSFLVDFFYFFLSLYDQIPCHHE